MSDTKNLFTSPTGTLIVEKIKRYSCIGSYDGGSEMEEDDYGDYVLFVDHQARIAAHQTSLPERIPVSISNSEFTFETDGWIPRAWTKK